MNCASCGYRAACRAWMGGRWLRLERAAWGNLCRFFLSVRGTYFIGEQSVATKTPNTLAKKPGRLFSGGMCLTMAKSSPDVAQGPEFGIAYPHYGSSEHFQCTVIYVEDWCI